jgi:hypothetical protein
MKDITKGQSWNLFPCPKITQMFQLTRPKGNCLILRRPARTINPVKLKSQKVMSLKNQSHHHLRSTTQILLHLSRGAMTIPTTAVHIPVLVLIIVHEALQAVRLLTELHLLAPPLGRVLTSRQDRVRGRLRKFQLLLVFLETALRAILRPKSLPSTLMLTLTMVALFQSAPPHVKVFHRKPTQIH